LEVGGVLSGRRLGAGDMTAGDGCAGQGHRPVRRGPGRFAEVRGGGARPGGRRAGPCGVRPRRGRMRTRGRPSLAVRRAAAGCVGERGGPGRIDAQGRAVRPHDTGSDGGGSQGAQSARQRSGIGGFGVFGDGFGCGRASGGALRRGCGRACLGRWVLTGSIRRGRRRRRLFTRRRRWRLTLGIRTRLRIGGALPGSRLDTGRVRPRRPVGGVGLRTRVTGAGALANGGAS
jgi:hypothetical protein